MVKEKKLDDKNIKEFVERIDAMKKLNPKDLSSDQDLSIAVMNLISIEEHLMFSGAKTGKTSFYDLIETVREMRKQLMQKMIKAYEGEVWCISKHLLATSMRLMEVGTKQQSMGNSKEAYDLFEKSYELYCLFWGLNMNAINLDTVKSESSKIIPENLANPIANNDTPQPSTTSSKGAMSKLKDAIKHAVNCCIE